MSVNSIKNSPSKNSLVLGIFYGASAGFFWGLPFLVPQVLAGYSSVEIAFGRFFFFGLVSLFFIKSVFRIMIRLSAQAKVKVLILSATGFWAYSLLLFWSVQKTNGVISSLILGLLPVTIPLAAIGKKKSSFRFYFGLFLILAGLFNLFRFSLDQASGETPVSVLGVVGLVLCLWAWTYYSNANAKFLKQFNQISGRDLSSVMGVISLLCMTPLFLFRVDLHEFLLRPHFQLFILLSFALGAGASWFANWLWNLSSNLCPPSVTGPLIVTEAIFGLLYTFIYRSRLPHGYEVVTIILFLIGVILAVRDQIKKHSTS